MTTEGGVSCDGVFTYNPAEITLGGATQTVREAFKNGTFRVLAHDASPALAGAQESFVTLTPATTLSGAAQALSTSLNHKQVLRWDATGNQLESAGGNEGEVLRVVSGQHVFTPILDGMTPIDLASGVVGILPISKGGSGAATASQARVNLGTAASGANSDITSITGLTTALAINMGGTGGNSAAAARGALGVAQSGVNSDITALTAITTPLSIAAGGTNAGTASAARASLGCAASGANSDITALNGLTQQVTISQGGTNAGTAVGARSNLGAAASGANTDITALAGLTTPITPAQGGFGSNFAGFVAPAYQYLPLQINAAGTAIIVDVLNLSTTTVAGQLPVARGGTAASSAAGARTNLGVEIGTDVQAWHSKLDALVGLASFPYHLIGLDGNGNHTLAQSSAFVYNLLTSATAAAARSILASLASGGYTQFDSVEADGSGNLVAVPQAGYGQFENFAQIGRFLAGGGDSTNINTAGPQMIVRTGTGGTNINLVSAPDANGQQMFTITDVLNTEYSITLAGSTLASRTIEICGWFDWYPVSGGNSTSYVQTRVWQKVGAAAPTQLMLCETPLNSTGQPIRGCPNFETRFLIPADGNAYRYHLEGVTVDGSLVAVLINWTFMVRVIGTSANRHSVGYPF